MSSHRTAALVLAFLLTSPLALAQEQGSTAREQESGPYQQPQPGQQKPKSPPKTDAAKEKSDAAKKTETSKEKGKKKETTTVAGEKATQADEDLDLAIGKTTTTAAGPGQRDVIESRAEQRREAEGRNITVAPLVGAGTNDLGVGIGVRAGYTFDSRVYVGGTGVYHMGSENVRSGPGVTDSQSRLYYPAVEVGYDIGIGPVLVRPYGGTAILFGRISTTTNGVDSSVTESALMVYPGVTASYILPRSPVFVGADTRLLLPFENQGASLNLFATAGIYQ